MSLAELIPILIKGSIMLVAFGFGLKATWSDATFFFRHPMELVRSFVAMNIVMLLFAIILVKTFQFDPPIKLALIILALSPVPPFLPGKQIKAGGHTSYVYGLLAGMSLLAIVAVPLLVTLMNRLFNLDTYVAPEVIAKILLLTVLVPLCAGILFRTWKASWADRLAKVASMLGNIVLLVSMIFVLTVTWRAMGSLIGNGTILAFIAFAAVGLGVGHLLGGPDPDNRSSLALATASRHPAVAIAIAHATFPEQKLEQPAVLLYLIVSIIVSIPYMKWREHQLGTPPEPKGGHRWRPGTT